MPNRLNQSIGLGIDFSSFDRDLRMVADKIEHVGKSASVKAGNVAGDLAGGQFDPGQVANLVSNVGTRLATGMADGVRRASGLMLGFTAHVDKMLDKLVGSAVTIFRRIDAAMKFPAFDNFFKTAQLRLSNFSAIWRKPLSDLDIALEGGMGEMLKQASRIMKVLVDQMAATISTALKEAVASVAVEFAKVAANATRAEASVHALLDTTTQTDAVVSRFPKFPPLATPGTASRPFPGVGRRLGAQTEFVGPPQPKPIQAPKSDPRLVAKELLAVFRETAAGAGVLISVFGKVGAALVSVPLRAYVPLARLTNFLSTIGDVGKQSFRKIFEQHGIVLGTILSVTSAVMKLGTALLHVGTLGVFRKAKTDVDDFGKSVKLSAAPVAALGNRIRSVGREILVAFGVVGVLYKVVQFFKAGVMGASDLNEAMSRSKVVFGDAFGRVEVQSAKLNRAFGISRQAQLDVASGFGAMAQGAGFSEAASASLANQLTKMAADLSSSVNIPFEEAGVKIRAALAGEAEPLRQFGANITETAVKAYAMANGLAKSSKVLTDQEKITARAALIMQGLAYAQGDLERTGGDAANQFRKAGGGIQEFGIRIGALLLPAIKLGTVAFNEFLAAVLDVFEASLPTIQTWAAAIASAMERVGMVARNLGDIWRISQLRVGEFVSNSIAWIETIPSNFGPITEWIGRNWWNILVDLGNMASTAFTNLLDNATRFGPALWEALKGNGFQFDWTPLLDGFKATTEQLPELIRPDLISVDDEVNALWAGIAKKEADRAKALNMPAGQKPKPPITGEPTKTPEYKLASAVEIGTKEAYSIIARSLSGGRTNDPAREQVRAVRDGNAILRDIDSKIGKQGTPVVVK